MGRISCALTQASSAEPAGPLTWPGSAAGSPETPCPPPLLPPCLRSQTSFSLSLLARGGLTSISRFQERVLCRTLMTMARSGVHLKASIAHAAAICDSQKTLL